MRPSLKRAAVAVAGALLLSLTPALSASAEPAALSGTLVDDLTGNAVQGCVTAYDLAYTWSDQACTDDTGAWSMTNIPAGVPYKLQASAWDTAFLPEWANDAADFDSAAEIVGPATVAFRLARSTTLTGSLKLADGQAADGTTVTVWPVGADAPLQSTTVWDGTWVASVPEGDYQVEYENLPLHQWAHGKAGRAEADVVHADAGTTSTVDDVLTLRDAVSFEGALTDARTGEPVDGCVTAYTASSYEWAASACADSGNGGHWSIYGLPTGVGYKLEVQTWDGVHLPEWAQDASDFEHATAYTAPATVDITLATGSMVQGTLRAADGSPVASGWTQVLRASDHETVAWADVHDGQWSASVPAGDYVVALSDFQTNQYAYGAEHIEDASVVHVGAGDTVTVDDTMLGGAVVQGTVTSDANGAPVAGACVELTGTGPDGGWGYGCADESGHYRVSVGTAGTYVAHFTDPVGAFVNEYSGDTRVRTSAATFTLTRGAPTTLDASLAPAGFITGRAVDAKTGLPVEGACPAVHAGRAGDRVWDAPSDCSSADGTWTVKGLPAGSYTVYVGLGGGPYASAGLWANNAKSQAKATLFSVSAGRTARTHDVKIGAPGSLSGRITDASGHPVPGALVNPRGSLSDRSGECFNCAVTDADGRYVIHGLAAGIYRPVVERTWESPVFAPEWAGDASSYEAADSVKVKSGRTATFSAQVGPASVLSGEVVTAGGAPAEGYWTGEVLSATGRHLADFDVWQGNTFAGVVLPRGDVRIRLENAETRQVVWYDGATSADAATVVTLGEGEQRHLTVHVPAP